MKREYDQTEGVSAQEEQVSGQNMNRIRRSVELFLSILLVLAVIVVGVMAWLGAQTEEPDLFDGFRTEEGGIRYYDMGVFRTGWQKIDDKTYYFRLETGYMVHGMLTIGGNYYAFDENGVQVKNGFVSDDTGTRYFRDGVCQYGWQTIDDKLYYFRSGTGLMVTGSETIGGVRYEFGVNGELLSPLDESGANPDIGKENLDAES